MSIGIQQNFPDLYLGYFILGYYLHQHGLPFKLKNGGLWFIIVTIIQMIASATIYNKAGTYQELMILPYSITVLFQALFFYSWMQNLKTTTTPKWMMIISVSSFGIYLIHPLIIEGLRIGIGKYHLDAKIADTLLSIPITWLTTFCLSVISVLLLLKIPYLKKLVS